MGMHVERHGWRYPAPTLPVGLMSIATLAAEPQSTATGVIEEVEVTGIRQSLLRMHRDNESNRIGLTMSTAAVISST